MDNRSDKPSPPPKPEKKKPTLLGDKQRAGRLLSANLRRIAQEETELIAVGTSEERMATKAEALARLMWSMALGYKVVDAKSGLETVHAPDKGMIGLLWDRIEGRAGPVNDSDAKKRSLPKKVSDENKKRLNNMVTGDTDTNI